MSSTSCHTRKNHPQAPSAAGGNQRSFVIAMISAPCLMSILAKSFSRCFNVPESHKESCVERIINWLSKSVAFALDLEGEINLILSVFSCFCLGCSYHKALFQLWARSR